MSHGRTQFKSVCKTKPCKVCNGDHKCSRGEDGLILCGRPLEPVDVPGYVFLGRCKGDSQFAMYRREGDPLLSDRKPARPDQNQKGEPTCDWDKLLSEQEKQFTSDLRTELAAGLGLPEAALTTLRIGWVAEGPHRNPESGATLGPCWTFAETNATGAIIGLLCRYRNSVKKAWPGSKRGLTIPAGWQERGGPVCFPEGPSDVLASTALGLPAIGRPSNKGGLELLADLLHAIPADRQILVLGEMDANEKGQWPGRDGAVETAASLARLLGCEIHWALPPAKAKDVRAWVQMQGLDLTLSDSWQEAGEKFRAALTLHTVKPSAEHRKDGPVDGAPAFADPIPASQLRAGDAASNWVWRGYSARGSITLLTSLWKAGKSTLLSHLVEAMGEGRALAGLAVAAGKVLVVSEESSVLWARRRDKLGIGDHALFYIRPFLGRPDPAGWNDFVRHVAGLVPQYGLALVCFDTLAALWPVDDENDAAKVMAALTPLHRITDAGAGVLLSHHPRKGDAAQGQASRGSGALPGFVDVILEMRRAQVNDRANRQRALTAYSRFDETPAELIIELAEDASGYRSLGSPADADRQGRWQTIQDHLLGQAPGLTLDELLSRWPEHVPKPGRRTIAQDLKAGAECGRWSMAGKGICHDPFRFWGNGESCRAPKDPKGARQDTNGQMEDEWTA